MPLEGNAAGKGPRRIPLEDSTYCIPCASVSAGDAGYQVQLLEEHLAQSELHLFIGSYEK